MRRFAGGGPARRMKSTRGALPGDLACGWASGRIFGGELADHRSYLRRDSRGQRKRAGQVRQGDLQGRAAKRRVTRQAVVADHTQHIHHPGRHRRAGGGPAVPRGRPAPRVGSQGRHRTAPYTHGANYQAQVVTQPCWAATGWRTTARSPASSTPVPHGQHRNDNAAGTRPWTYRSWRGRPSRGRQAAC